MYELFTLGGGPYLVDLLNAVAAITSGGAYVTLAQLAGAGGVAWVVFRTAFGGSWRDNAKWILLFVAVWGAMIVPKATVRVVDRLDPALAPAVVANVPIGLALFASVTSQVGDGLTRLTEQAFTLPNDLAYRRHGLIFGARLAATATRLEVTDAVFARNLRNFTRQCVFHALLLGHISADDLRESTDVWALVTAGGSPSAGASPARMFEFATRQPAGATGATPVDKEIVTCRDGAARLNAAWAAEIARAGTLFGRRIFPDARTQALARAELLAALPAAHDFLIGASRSAAEILRQQMVLNAVHDAGEQWAAEAGNTAALQTYTEARAEAQTAAAYRAIGRQAETWVPLLRIVFECLYVGAFPLAVLLMLTPAGMTIFRSIRHRADLAPELGAALRDPAPDLDGGGGRADAGGRAHAGGRRRDLARGPGRDPRRGGRRRGDERVPLDVDPVPGGGARLRALEGDGARDLGARRRPGRRDVGGARGDDRQPLARQHAVGHAPVREPGGPPAPDLGARRHRPVHGLRPGGCGFTVTPDGTAVADMGSATSRVPAAGVRLSESLAVSHEERAAEARSMGRNWDVQAATARTAAATDATQLVERYAHDVSTGTAHSHGIAGSESAEVRELASHVEKLAELGNLSKDQTMTLTGEASLGGGLPGFLRLGARGSATWRGQTVEHDAWNRMQEYDRQHGVTDLWSRVQEASRRYSTSTGDSELASLEESLGANLTRMQRFEDRAALSYAESEQWSEQAAAVRADAQSIERELGQPFFAWLAEREGTDGRPIGAGGAMRIASPQTPEDAEALRGHAAAFIAERFPAPVGPDPAAVAGGPAFEAARGDFEQAHGPAAGTAHAAWATGVREHAAGAGAPGPGVATDSAAAGRGDVEAELAAREADRQTRDGSVRSDIGAGRAAIATENVRPLREHATEGVPFVGEWLAGKLYGTARNSAPDAAEQQAEENPAERRSGPDWGGP